MKIRFTAPALALLLALPAVSLLAQIKPTGALEGLTAPKPEVEEIYNVLGEFVRNAYNNQGYAVIGYRMVQQEVGNPWILLNLGVTLRAGVKDYRLTRDALTVKTPDGKIIPLSTQQEYAKDLTMRALNERARIVRDSINYFPPGTTQPCAIRFFAEPDGPGLSYDFVDLLDVRACLGRLYFKVPGGIQTGQHWLNVKFATSTVQVPFRVFTKDEEKAFRKQWDGLAKALEESYK
jgi:hypothetical protein